MNFSIKNGVFEHKLYRESIKEEIDHPKTLLEVFEKRVFESGDNGLFGVIKDGQVLYEPASVTWSKILKISEFLKAKTVSEQRIGIFSINCPEWIISQVSSFVARCTTVPLYSTYSPVDLNTIIEESELEMIFMSSDKAKKFYEVISESNLQRLKYVIVFDLYSGDEHVINNLKDVEVHYFNELVQNNDDFMAQSRFSCKPDDIAIICYTSGTTGKPKGVQLSHRNILSQLKAFQLGCKEKLFPAFDKDDVYFSYLPLAHVLELMFLSISITTSAKICFYSGNPKMLADDLKIAKPTIFPSVPRVLIIFEEKIKAKISQKNVFIRFLFVLALKYKVFMQQFGWYESWIFDFLIFSKISAEFGGRIKFSLSGGASINSDIIKFLQAIFSCRIIQGYGQTEAAAANIIQPITTQWVDSVGEPFPSTRLRLLPVEGYNAEYQGELLLNGPSVMQGYYLMKEETEEKFVEIEGEKWLKTGDVASFENDHFCIIGRTKDIFKTSYGEYINPEAIENLLTGGIIKDLLIGPDSRNANFVHAIVVVDSISNTSEAEILDEIKIRGDELVKSNKMNRYEIPVSCTITCTSFVDLEDGSLVTPTLKKKRTKLLKFFENSRSQKKC